MSDERFVYDLDKRPVPWARGDREPYVRAEMRCPFCGAEQLRMSYDDTSDARRVELYCENWQCEVRELVVLAMRVDPLVGGDRRRDVGLLHALDAEALGMPASHFRRRAGKALTEIEAVVDGIATVRGAKDDMDARADQAADLARCDDDDGRAV